MTSDCHSRIVKCSAPARMILETASSTSRSAAWKGNAACISSKERRPQRKKSFTCSRPVGSIQKAVATASATSSTPIFPELRSKCVGTGKSGRLKGTRAKLSQNMRLVSSAGKGWPLLRARTAATEGVRNAAKTSQRSAALSSGGQAPSASKARLKAPSSKELVMAASILPTLGAICKAWSKALALRSPTGISMSAATHSCNASSKRRKEFCTRLFSQYRVGSRRASLE
mmetsp:Transcript_66599/g.147511  ORF Transcript_66599/g.147511 Transcript_66599/m.147511 type:complete len:229 (+) Transcript_66599:894-1580(+)